MYGVRKYDHFTKHFREILIELIKLEPRLVVIPFPDGDTSKNERPFAHECSMISSSYQCRIYVDQLVIGEGKPTSVKVFVGHDMPSAVFSSLEVAQKIDEIDNAVRVCPIQSSKVVVTGYLGGSTKTLDVQNWTKHYNVHSCLFNVNVEVKLMNIKDPNRESIKWSPKNQVIDAHILCAEKDLEKVVIEVGNIHNKVRKSSRAAGEVPEARMMKWVPYGSTNIIKQTSKRHFQLQKNRIMHKWRLEQHHTVPFWGSRQHL